MLVPVKAVNRLFVLSSKTIELTDLKQQETIGRDTNKLQQTIKTISCKQIVQNKQTIKTEKKKQARCPVSSKAVNKLLVLSSKTIGLTS